MAESLKGKVAVITGVGSGFAKATAELFATVDQVGLVLIDINEKALEATADVCRAAGSKVVALAGDVTKPETFERALKETLDTFGKVDFLINYAGGALKVAPIEEMDDAINRRIIDLNLTSTIMSCRTFTPQFKQQGYGKIINVSSACDRRSWQGWSVYSAAKAGVNAFTKCLYTELRPSRHRRHAPRAGRIQHRFPGGGSRRQQVRVGRVPGRAPRTLRRYGVPDLRAHEGRLCLRDAGVRAGAGRQRVLICGKLLEKLSPAGFAHYGHMASRCLT